MHRKMQTIVTAQNSIFQKEIINLTISHDKFISRNTNDAQHSCNSMRNSGNIVARAPLHSAEMTSTEIIIY